MNSTRSARVAAIILAAGQSSRVGATKQLLLLEDRPLLQHVIDSAMNSSVADVLLVLGHDAETIRQTIDTRSATVVLNPAYRDGQSSSLRAGVDAARERFDAVVVLQGDQPGITPAIIDSIIDRFRQTHARIVIPRYQGRRGNPVLIEQELFPALKTISGDTGARAIFNDHASDIVYVDFDFPSPPDVDTLEDFQKVNEAADRQTR